MAFDSMSSLSSLSAAELSSLEKLCSAGACARIRIPDRHAVKLMKLGLVELIGGSLEPLGQSRIYVAQLSHLSH